MRQDKISAAILFGGVSSEYEVSLQSAFSVIEKMDRAKYEPVLIGITREGRWLLYTGPADQIPQDRWCDPDWTVPAFISPDRSVHGLVLPNGRDGKGCSYQRIDVAFPVLHGKNGEDGTIQGLLQLAGIPYVGSGVLSCAATMDKETTHILLESAGIRTAPWRTVRREDVKELPALQGELEAALGYPLFVKPANAGSSVGISKVKTPDRLSPALELAFRHDGKVLVERAVSNPIEVEVAVLGNPGGDITVSAPGEVVPCNEFYDYNAKYIDNASQLYIPARLDPAWSEQVRAIAARAYRALGCRGLCRIDFLLCRDSGENFLNEANALPGFTSISMYPKLMMASGTSYAGLIDRLLSLAMEDGDAQS